MAQLTGSIGAPHATSDVATTPFPMQLGTRMRDSSGNEYVYVRLTAAVYSEQPVEILSDYTAQPLGTSGRGLIGIVQGAATSVNAGWVQVFGRAIVQLGNPGASPSDAGNGPTTLSNSLATVFVLATSATSPNGIGWVSGAAAAATSALQYVIEGMAVASDASVGDVTATCTTTSHIGHKIAVFLNYPSIKLVDITTG